LIHGGRQVAHVSDSGVAAQGCRHRHFAVDRTDAEPGCGVGRTSGARGPFSTRTLSSGEAAAIERRLRAGELDLVYIAPERLMTDRAQRLLVHLAGASGIALFRDRRGALCFAVGP